MLPLYHVVLACSRSVLCQVGSEFCPPARNLSDVLSHCRTEVEILVEGCI